MDVQYQFDLEVQGLGYIVIHKLKRVGVFEPPKVSYKNGWKRGLLTTK